LSIPCWGSEAEESEQLIEQAVIRRVEEQPDISHRDHRQHRGREEGEPQNPRPRDWKRLYSGGIVTNWLQQTTDFFMANAGVKDFTPASKYFDPSLYLKTIA
jgi:hypothetical protein